MAPASRRSFAVAAWPLAEAFRSGVDSAYIFKKKDTEKRVLSGHLCVFFVFLNIFSQMKNKIDYDNRNSDDNESESEINYVKVRREISELVVRPHSAHA